MKNHHTIKQDQTQVTGQTVYSLGKPLVPGAELRSAASGVGVAVSAHEESAGS